MTELVDCDFWLRDVLDDLSRYHSVKSRSLRAKSYVRILTQCYRDALVDLSGVEFGKILIDSVLRGYYNHKHGIACDGCSRCTHIDECGRYEYWRKLHSGNNLKACRLRMGSYLRIYTKILDINMAYEVGIYDAEVFGSP
jgi:hypothetical protein